jgi:hypothetical protein
MQAIRHFAGSQGLQPGVPSKVERSPQPHGHPASDWERRSAPSSGQYLPHLRILRVVLASTKVIAERLTISRSDGHQVVHLLPTPSDGSGRESSRAVANSMPPLAVPSSLV